jgi:hypothetical protein
MKQTINNSQFIDAFRDCDRFDQFGHSALNLLFEHFESREGDTGEEMDLYMVNECF